MDILTIYLAGKVEGTKWKVVPTKDPRFKFCASDGSNHSEHNSGYANYDFQECSSPNGVYAELVKEGFIDNLNQCQMLLAYLDTKDSYGSIAEIAYASARGIPCHVVVQRNTAVMAVKSAQPDFNPVDYDGMFDAYYFVCSFPNVTVTEVASQLDGTQVVSNILNKAFSYKYVNSFKFVLE